MKRTVLVVLAVLLAIAVHVGLSTLQAQVQAVRVASEATKERIRQAVERLADAQHALIDEDVYHCCIKPVCTFCAISGARCPCADNLASGRGGVCPECFGGWYANQGDLEGKITTNSKGQLEFEGELIKIMPISLLKTRYAVRADSLAGTSGAGGADQ